MTQGSVNSGALLYVVAAGNSSEPSISSEYPAALGGGAEPILTVAALNAAGHVADFSNKGATIDLAAPGCEISSWIDDKGTVATLSGTSQAAPTVSFAAALLKTVANQNAYQTKSRLIFSGDLLPVEDRSKLANPVKLNIERALYVGYDYVHYREGGQDHEVLGQVRLVEGTSCAFAASPPASTVQSLKVDAQNAAYLYYLLPAGQLSGCPAKVSPSGRVVIEPLFDPAASFRDISNTHPGDDAVTIPISEVLDFIRSGPVSAPGRQ
jgi:subtilisin family serine protease